MYEASTTATTRTKPAVASQISWPGPVAFQVRQRKAATSAYAYARTGDCGSRSQASTNRVPIATNATTAGWARGVHAVRTEGRKRVRSSAVASAGNDRARKATTITCTAINTQ